MPVEHNLVLLREDANERIDRVIVRRLGDRGEATTRAEVQRWIAAGRVTVAGQAVSKKDSFQEGTCVRIRPAPPLLTDAQPDPTVPFELVYQDEHVLVVDKPAGVVVHPARGHRSGTLVNGLLALPGVFEHLPIDPRDPEGNLRPGIVHRIDKDTSGLLVVAKTSVAREGLKALFQQHDIERSYLAIVQGLARKARYETLHGRHPKSRLRFSSRVRQGKLAITHVVSAQALAGGIASLVRCRLETGRTHQIRVHLAEQGNTPIVADALYGRLPPAGRLRDSSPLVRRQALHAAELGFVHPVSKERLHFESPLPSDMAALLAALREPA